MDDIKFFDTILPSQGLRCVAWLLPSGGWAHAWGKTNAWLAKTSRHLDVSENKDVYYGCSSFAPKAQDKLADGGGRKQVNVAWVRSFWVDLDVGEPEEGKPPKYPTQAAAAIAITKFALKLGMPVPGMTNSGWGVHAYWPMDADMLASDWKPVAEALKRALRASGVLFDPSRTADEASVLRPPGTRNHKHGTTRPVKVVKDPTVWNLTGMMTALLPWAQPAASPSIATAKLSDNNAALGGGMGPDPSSAYPIADQCAVIGMMRDTRGKLDQPTWYYSLGVLLHTDEAPAICHEWSKGDPRYTAKETSDNLARLSGHGATTCEKLSEFQPAACAACPHFGKIKSPIQLGRPRIEKATVERVERVVDKKGFATEHKVKLDLPWGYGEAVEDGKRVLTYTSITEDKEGNKTSKTITVANTLFWGVTRLWDEKGAVFEFEMVTREGARTFLIDGSMIAAGGRELSAELGRSEIVARRGGEAQVHGYMKGWLETLSRTSEQVRAHRSFGWFEDSFVLGDTVIRPDGTENRAILRGMAGGKATAVSRKGDLQTWVALVDRAYNAPGQEAFQFQIGCAFAAPLLSLMQQVKGVTVYAHTDGSGVGKTTVQKVGLSAWGNAEDVMLAHGKTTNNALWGLLGAYNSLPVVYDELTLAPNGDVSELVFSMSSGRAKERLSASGELRANNSNWSTILLASGNSLLSEKLAQVRSNTEAEVSRLFEFTLEADPHLSVADANALFPHLINEHYGHAGHAFARYVTMHRAEVVVLLQKMQAKLIKDFQLTQVERHWSALFASVLVAVYICRGLKLLAFDVDAIKAWMGTRLEENRTGKTEAITDHTELLSQMIDELWENVLVTQGVGDLRASSPIPVHIHKAPRGGIVGRSVRPTPADAADLFISRHAIHLWANKRGASAKAMRDAGVKAGLIHPEIKRHCLGRGTREYQTTENVFCWRFFPDALAVSLSDKVVTHLTVVGKP